MIIPALRNENVRSTYSKIFQILDFNYNIRARANERRLKATLVREGCLPLREDKSATDYRL